MTLEILCIRSRTGSTSADLRMGGSQRTLDTRQAAELLVRLPTLAAHACKSKGAVTFGERIVGALLPHVVEHVAIDLMVRRFPEAGPVSGNTVWLTKPTTMRVRISTRDAGAGGAAQATATAQAAQATATAQAAQATQAAQASQATATALSDAVALVNAVTMADKDGDKR